MLEVSLAIRCTKKPGTLSRVIREIKLFGLDYKSHGIKFEDESCLIHVNSSGELNCPREQLIETFEAMPSVVKVDRVSITRDGDEVAEFRTAPSNTRIAGTEEITPAVLLSAEKRMSEIIGPVADFLVEKAAQNSKTVAELYRNLADELDDSDERRDFLSVVENTRKPG